jgi:hypothetical protein
MGEEILAQHRLVERLAGNGRARMGVRIDQAGQDEPAVGEGLRPGHRAGPELAVFGPELDGLAVR